MCIFRFLAWLVIFELPRSLFWCLSLYWGKSHSLFLYLFVLFFSFMYSHYVYVIPFVIVPKFLDFCSFLFSFFIFAFHFGKLYLPFLKLSDSFLTHFYCTAKPSKEILHFCSVFYFLHFSFGSFLEFPSLLTFRLYSCILSPIYMRTLSTLIMIVLYFWFDNPTYLLHLNYVLLLLLSLHTVS